MAMIAKFRPGRAIRSSIVRLFATSFCSALLCAAAAAQQTGQNDSSNVDKVTATQAEQKIEAEQESQSDEKSQAERKSQDQQVSQQQKQAQNDNEDAEESNARFDPTEEISKDLSVSFPVDI